jgi:uncharacterized Zn-finger protein
MHNKYTYHALIHFRFTEEIELLRWATESGLTAHQMVISRLRELRSMSGESTLSSSVTCPYCQKVFSKTANVNRHVKTIHKNLKHVCTKCGKGFTRKCNMDRHTCTLQTEQQREFRCKVIIYIILFIYLINHVTYTVSVVCVCVCVCVCT